MIHVLEHPWAPPPLGVYSPPLVDGVDPEFFAQVSHEKRPMICGLGDGDGHDGLELAGPPAPGGK